MPNYPRDLIADDVNVPKPDTLYHYTGWPGVFAILDSLTLRMRHSAYLNDKNEMLEGISLIQRVLDTTTASHNESLGMHWANVREGWRRDFSSVSVFLASFCEERDTLDLWRAYAREGGAAIGFSSHQLRQAADKKKLWLLPCVYERALNADRIFKIVEHYSTSPADPSREHGDHFSDAVCGDLLLEIPRQKSEHFASEREWRLFTFGDTVDTSEPVQFLVSNRGIVPYLDFNFPADAITEIVVDPLSLPEAVLGLQEFLGRRRYDHIIVRQSDVPLRH